MAPDFLKVEVSMFYSEVYHKEKVTGVKWFEKNRRKIERSAVLDKEYQTLDEGLLEVLKILECHKEMFQRQRLHAKNKVEDQLKILVHTNPPKDDVRTD